MEEKEVILETEEMEAQNEDVETQNEEQEIVNEEATNELQEKFDDLNDQHQRLQAEYANYRRRTQQEKETMGLFANEKILNELVPVVDSMEMALQACNDKEDNIYKGIELVYKQIQNTLEKFGVEEIKAEDMDFDPNLHLAVMQENVEGVEPNKVVIVLQKGYKLANKVLRPSMVKVSC